MDSNKKLFMYAENGDLDGVRYLVEHGVVDINIMEHALLLSYRNRHMDVVRYLYHNGAGDNLSLDIWGMFREIGQYMTSLVHEKND